MWVQTVCKGYLHSLQSLLGNLQALLIFFQKQLFRKIHSGIPTECQTIWIQIMPNILSCLIWVRTVCKGYQQTALVGKFTLCPPGNFASFADFFSSSTFSKNSFRNTISVKQFGSRSGPTLCLGPNYLQMLSAHDPSDVKSKGSLDRI